MIHNNQIFNIIINNYIVIGNQKWEIKNYLINHDFYYWYSVRKYELLMELKMYSYFNIHKIIINHLRKIVLNIIKNKQIKVSIITITIITITIIIIIIIVIVKII